MDFTFFHFHLLLFCLSHEPFHGHGINEGGTALIRCTVGAADAYVCACFVVFFFCASAAKNTSNYANCWHSSANWREKGQTQLAFSLCDCCVLRSLADFTFFFFVCCPPLADLHPFGVISFGFCNFHRIYVLSGILNCIPNRNPIHDTAIIAACICSHSRCCSNGIGICGGIPPWLPTALYINYISAGKINIFMNFLSPVVHCGVGQKMYI